MGHRVLPQRSLEPLHTTQSPLFEDLAVMVGISSLATPVLLSMSCSQVSECALLLPARENDNPTHPESRFEGLLMFLGSDDLY